MESATVTIRPLRLAFLVKATDKASLRRVFQINSGLWGGTFNFIIPYVAKLPNALHLPHVRKQISAIAFMNGMIEAAQPDFLVEMKKGMANGLTFPSARILSLNELIARDRGRAAYGIDMRSLCGDLWQKEYQFVRRKPHKVCIPQSTDARYELLFACLFGEYGEEEPTRDFASHFRDALEGSEEKYDPAKFPLIYDARVLFPLSLTRHELRWEPRLWRTERKMFFFDSSNGYDLIDLWNMRAIGWRVAPLPASLAPQMKAYANNFIQDIYQLERNHPNNVPPMVQIVYARSQKHEDLHAYLTTLSIPENCHVVSELVPNLWEGSSRYADEADPCVVTHSTATVDASIIGRGLRIEGALPEFLDEDFGASTTAACANVIASVPGGAEVIPWRQNLASMTHDFDEEKTYVSRDGIVYPVGRLSLSRHLRVPTPENVFAALAEGVGYQWRMSPAGRTAQQIIKALGGYLRSSSFVLKSEQFVKYLNSMAHEDVEVDVTNEDVPKTIKKPYALYNDLKRILNQTARHHVTVENQLYNLVSLKVLRPGLTQECPECHHTSWFGLEDIGPTFTCPRCSHAFPFPMSAPPQSKDWAYRVAGPFAAENFAHGSYCVIAAMNLLCNEQRRKATWIPSFELINKLDKTKTFEADFGMFIEPRFLNQAAGPSFVIGECKSFNTFEDRDFERARQAMELFPGAVLCFATFREALLPREKQRLRAIANAGRRMPGEGQRSNPVIILTGKELFGQYKLGDFYDDYGVDRQWVRRIFDDGELREMADFTQVQHLGMKPHHEVLRAKSVRKAQRKLAASDVKTTSVS